MAFPTSFLSLPREIRDNVYEHYVTVPGGYKCDSDRFATNLLARNSSRPDQVSLAGTVKGVDGQAIDLNLSYTCRLVASEMRGVALRINTITISTVTSDQLRIIALRHELMLLRVFQIQRELIYYVIQTMPENLLTKVKLKYPPFVPVVEKMRNDTEHYFESVVKFDAVVKRPYGEACSLWNGFCKHVLELGLPPNADHEAVRRYFSVYTSGWFDERTVDEFIAEVAGVRNSRLADWSIPTENVTFNLLGDDLTEIEDARGTRDRVRYRFSAAAAAVTFLQNLDVGLRMQLRRIVLNEDGIAVANPQGHAQGLIHFCRENPRLFLERRVNLWSNALQCVRNGNDLTECLGSWRYDYQEIHRGHWKIDSRKITSIVNTWVIEALALSPAGMPAGSFSLVLDGQPLPHVAAQMFKSVVQRDVARQLAWEESVRRGIISAPSLFDPETKYSFGDGSVIPWNHFKHLPKAMKDIADKKSVIRCNFDVGDPWDVEKIVQDNTGWTVTQWRKQMGNGHEPETWETEAPLPSWRSMLEDNLIPIVDVLDMDPPGTLFDSITGF